MAWFLMQSLEHSHIHAWIQPMRNASSVRFPQIGPPTDSLLAFNAGVCELHFDLDAWTERGQIVMREVLKDLEWLNRVNRESAQEIDALRSMVKSFDQKVHDDLPSDILAEHVRLFFTSLKKCHLSGLPIVVLETRHELWTKYIRELVAQALKRAGRPLEDLPVAFSLLTTPDRPSARTQEKLARSKLYEKMRRDEGLINSISSEHNMVLEKIERNYPGFFGELKQHTEQFGWISYMYEGPGWGTEHFLKELMTMVENNANPQATERQLQHSHNDCKKLESSLLLTDDEQWAIALTRQLMYLKDERKDATYYAFAKTEEFWQTVSKRINRPLRLTRMLLPEEIINGLVGKAEIPDEIALRDRIDCSVIQYYEGEEALHVGKRAALALSQVIGEEEKLTDDKTFFSGTCAVPGTATGSVKIVNTPEEGRAMTDGQILVSVATDPSLEPTMARAAAIVTDMGGITCHAAIVSRELGIPCVVGTRNASKILKDGDLIEVNATKGTILRLQS